MKLALALMAVLCAPAAAGPLVQLARAQAAPLAPVQLLFGGRPEAWSGAMGPDLSQIEALYGIAGAAPVLRALAEKHPSPEAFARLSREARADQILKAATRVIELAGAQAQAAAAEEASADPASPEYAVLFARLQMLNGPLRGLVEENAARGSARAYARALERLDQARRQRLLEHMDAISKSLEAGTLFERAAADLPRVPSSFLSPAVARLRAARAAAPRWDFAASQKAPKLPRSLKLKARLAAYGGKRAALRLSAQKIFVPARDAFRWTMGHGGAIWRKYWSGQEMDRHTFRFGVAEGLFKAGDFRASFGHPLYDGDVKVMSPLVFREKEAAALRAQKVSIGSDLIVAGERIPVQTLEVSPMLGVSGMSFPQLSAQSHLSLLYITLKLAKEQGVSMLQNTGEGGPGLHLALLQGDATRAIRYIVDWNVENKQFPRGSAKEAEVVGFVERLMASRDALFAEFSPQDLARAQIVAQFGSALNGIRAEGGYVDFEKLRAVAASPHVRMTQYKLKQAAKRGAKVDPRKVDEVVAALREIPRDKPFKSPELNPDFSSYEDIAALLKAAKIVTRKPVSLKFGVGDVEDAAAFLEFLRDAGAMPDHIQLDGAGMDFSPGSGNAPPGADTSLPVSDAVIVVDAVLKKLGVREHVFLEASGDVLLPIDGVEKLALGADGVSAARCWMAMGLGCAMVKACAEGSCPYGIAAKSDSFAGLTLDPAKIPPKGYLAAANWQKAYVQTLAEAGLTDWRRARGELGLAARSNALRVKDGRRSWTLDWVYGPEYVANLMRGVMDRAEVDRVVFGR